MKKIRMMKRAVPLWVVIVLVVVLSSFAVAVSINVLPISHISIYTGQTQSSVFTIYSQAIKFHGPDKMTINLVLANTAASTAYANATIYLEDSSGNNIMNLTEPTGPVSASSTVSLAFAFDQSGIASSYSSDFIQITDS